MSHHMVGDDMDANVALLEHLTKPGSTAVMCTDCLESLFVAGVDLYRRLDDPTGVERMQHLLRTTKERKAAGVRDVAVSVGSDGLLEVHEL